MKLSTKTISSRFQHQNMAAAVSSAVQSKAHSMVNSNMASKVGSRVISTATSLMGSRCDSMSSLVTDTDGPLPGTIEQIQAVTEHQEAVMSFYYTGEDNQLKLMEIFDVTQTDPQLLVGDELGVNYSEDQVILSHTRSTGDIQGSGAQSGRHRHHSDSAAFLQNKMRSFNNKRQTSFDSRTPLALFGG